MAHHGPMPDSVVIRVPDPCLVVLVGAAGSGKSTFAARHFAPDEVLSSDGYRKAVSGDATDQGATRPAFARLHRDVERRLVAGRTVVVDATSVQLRARRELLRIARASGRQAIAIVLDLPAGVVLARNAGRRAGIVPEAAVRRHLADLRATMRPGVLEAEGFTAVVRLASPTDVDAARVRRDRA